MRGAAAPSIRRQDEGGTRQNEGQDRDPCRPSSMIALGAFCDHKEIRHRVHMNSQAPEIATQQYGEIATLYVICGLTCAGKTTFAKQMEVEWRA